ncbi:hypothetical protein C5167_003171 [Papaver somniferum]|uniref:Uncharacterized protein n=1 Tax=Papaver somniferum TaxID=3469 RepID=A0A4Y7L059_PAPSO|nr:hypothetical protein C5167_003171 [Papaver somniferum]
MIIRFTVKGGKMKLKAMLTSYMSHMMYQFGRIPNLGPILVQDDDIQSFPRHAKKVGPYILVEIGYCDNK